MERSFDALFSQASLFFLAAVRVFALMFTVPLLSVRSVSRVVRVALAGLIAFLVLPLAYPAPMQVREFSAYYVLLLLGEGLLGILTGFFISVIFTTFSAAGQFFSYQMGFGTSEMYDTFAQIENPLMGQFLNFVAMLVFLQIKGFQILFLGGVLRSFQAVNCFVFLRKQEALLLFFTKALSALFLHAMTIALPIMGALLLIHVSMGLLTKAAPQMNLLSEGLPLTIVVTFVLLSVILPYMINLFVSILFGGFEMFEQLLVKL
ncbi:flagellar biosynthetic protein FliR, partial [Treponema pallidum]